MDDCKIVTVEDGEDFSQRLKAAGERLVVVDFFAQWCGPCKTIAPHLQEMATSMVEKVVFLKVDVDDCEELATEYGVKAMPTFILFRGGHRVAELAGANVDKLKQLINDHKNKLSFDEDF